jgi:thiamine-monophosphate kinase
MNSEFDFIEKIRRRAARGSALVPDLHLGIGDDTAILGEESGRETLITVDLLVEEVDFRLEYAVPRWLGHKALAVSLSDIAAMGGDPRFALLTLGIPPSLISRERGQEAERFWEEFFDGYFELAERHGVTLIGGDISAVPAHMTIDSIVIGHARKGQAVRRSNAQQGQGIYVTGEIGASATGLRRLLAGERANPQEESPVQQAIRSHLAPDPRVEFGRQLGRCGLVGAMIDVSDGLGQDLHHLCEESRVGAIIVARELPVAACLSVLGLKREDSLGLALEGGEDFELLFTAAPEAEERLREMAGPDLRLSRIGTIVPPRSAGPAILIQDEDGASRPLSIKGHDHFAT